MIVARRFSLTNFVIATSALCFQVFVLYPWHKQLDEDFAELRKKHMETLQAIRGGEQARIVELKEIKEGLSSLKRRGT